MSDPIADLAADISEREPPPVVVGITGAVAVGKTTIATELADRLAAAGRDVRVLSTDAFLLSNAVLAERDILMKKGFPESYDTAAIVRTIAAARRGERTTIPVYSHAIYDLVPGEAEIVDPADVVVLEGVIALQPAIRGELDIGIYIDTPDDIVRGWFVDRFLRFTADAHDDPASFYHGMSRLDRDQVRSIAEMTWDGINGVNLTEHIAPTRASADVVIEKGADHRVLAVHRPD